MALSPMNFQNLTPQGPGYEDILPAIMQGLQAAYAPAQNKASLQGKDLENALKQIQLQYAPQTAEANLGYKGAQTDYLKEQTQLDPLKQLIAAQNSERAGSRFGQVYQFSKILANLDPKARASYIADHQKQYNDMIDVAANAAANPKPSNYSALIADNISKIFNQGKQPGNASSSQVDNAPYNGPFFNQKTIPSDEEIRNSPLTINPAEIQNLQKGGVAKVPLQSQAAPFQTSPETTDRMRLVNEMSVNKGLTTNDARKQAEGSVNFDQWLNNSRATYAPMIENVTKYAGAKGKGKLTLDALKETNPQSYQDYQTFMHVWVPQAQNHITRLEGSTIDVRGTNEIKDMFRHAVNSMTTDPASAVKYLDRTMELLGKVSQERINTAEPAYKGTYNQAYGFKGIPGNYVSGGQPAAQIPGLPAGQPQAAGQSNLPKLSGDQVWIKAPNGKLYPAHKSNVKDALLHGGVQING